MTCRTCGDKAKLSCGCGATVCDRHAHYYADAQNRAITASAKPTCPPCAGIRIPRPFTEVQAIEALEW